MKKLLLVPALALVLGAAACGGDKDKAADPPSASTAPSNSAAAGGTPSEQAPAGGAPTVTPSSSAGGGEGGAYQQDMNKMAACLREKGWNAKVPDGGGYPVITGVKDSEQAKFQKDNKECYNKYMTPPGG
ncbi:hypothetical protein [Actinomadura atramentaria]|uniref:hypothetical protein n=1 Tax=Actinomadura atramentaria TaxID=1990 RepID=UPI0003A0C165|nr:hypothetical protein [Actinomadura atramentaria]